MPIPQWRNRHFIDVLQQRLNCALPVSLFELWFLSIPKSSRHIRSSQTPFVQVGEALCLPTNYFPYEDFGEHLKRSDLAVDLFNRL